MGSVEGTMASADGATNFTDMTKEERRKLIADAEAARQQAATLTITGALRLRRFRKIMRNNSLTGNDPALAHLRMCVVRRIAALSHLNMEENVAKVCDWYRKVFHSEEGVALAKSAREKRELSGREWVYGEVQFHHFVDVLKTTNPRRGEKFVDLGSGMGKAVFAAHLYFQFSTCIGIEFLDELHAAANNFAKTFDNEIKMLFDEGKRVQRIAFEHKNFMHALWKDADVVFIAATAFDDAIMATISKKCELLKPGSRIVTLTRQLVNSDACAFKEINRQHCYTSFGPATAFVFERIDPLALEKDRERRRAEAGEDVFN